MAKTCLVVTSIGAPNGPLRALADGAQRHGMPFIVIGDEASPRDFDLPGCRFYDLTRQRALAFSFVGQCPTRHYARKNIGYLLALSEGADVIVETDDDNFPRESFWTERRAAVGARQCEGQGWVNVYRYFSDAPIWPRGLPLEEVKTPAPPLAPDLRPVEALIQQGLADANPDVDAVYRLTLPLPQSFQDAPPVALGKGAWCPFNSQNTTWWRAAAPLMYLPSSCPLRLCDVWRSFVTQRIAWENGWPIVFHAATVEQERNEHDLMADFRDEVPGYLHNAEIAEVLAQTALRPGRQHMRHNMEACYAALVSRNLLAGEEMARLSAWLDDLAAIGIAA